jgi:hypothetical protein
LRLQRCHPAQLTHHIIVRCRRWSFASDWTARLLAVLLDALVTALAVIHRIHQLATSLTLVGYSCIPCRSDGSKLVHAAGLAARELSSVHAHLPSERDGTTVNYLLYFPNKIQKRGHCKPITGKPSADGVSLTTNLRLDSQTARINIRHPAQTPLCRSIFYVVISTYTVA